MKSLSQRLVEQFIIELSEGPTDSTSPISGGEEEGPDPTHTVDGHRELQVGDLVRVVGKVYGQGETGIVDDLSRNKHFVVVKMNNGKKNSFHESDLEYYDYDDDEDEDDRELENLRKLSGYQ